MSIIIVDFVIFLKEKSDLPLYQFFNFLSALPLIITHF